MPSKAGSGGLSASQHFAFSNLVVLRVTEHTYVEHTDELDYILTGDLGQCELQQ